MTRLKTFVPDIDRKKFMAYLLERHEGGEDRISKFDHFMEVCGRYEMRYATSEIVENGKNGFQNIHGRRVVPGNL